MDAGDINIWRVWILDKTVARRIVHLEVEGEVAALHQRLHLLNKFINLSSDLWVELAAFLLHLADAFNSGHDITFDCLD